MSDIHICTGVNPTYRCMARQKYQRKWTPCGPAYPNEHGARREMSNEILTGGWYRIVVTYAAEYYDPAPICEWKRL